MWKHFICLWGILFLGTAANCQSYGLKFSSHEVVPEKRTALDLTPEAPLCLGEGAELSFDLVFTPNLEIYFGYIMRLVTAGRQNIDIVYNHRLRNFSFVVGETFSGAFNIDSLKLFGQWNQFRIRFSEKEQAVFFYLNNQFICRSAARLGHPACCRLYFGANHHEGSQTMDIPPMNLRDIRIMQQGKLLHHYPLSESQGGLCADVAGKSAARVRNPVWIKPRHQRWEKVCSLSVRGTPGIAFDSKKEVLYIATQDSLYRLPFRDLQPLGLKLASPRSLLPAGNQGIYDTAAGRLYNFYIDEKKVSVYDTALRRWDSEYSNRELTEFWQANKFLSPADTSLYIIGGYGQLRYKKLVQRYHFPGRRWETVPVQGDPFMPRYMAALGVNAAQDTAYILGGYGSNTGEQAINPKCSYELLAYSVRNRSFKSLAHLQEPPGQYCFANSLVIGPAGNDFYALMYPIDRFNSSLQLIKGSLHSAAYQPTGDSIPYSFYDIRSFADLYYLPLSKKLAAVTLYTSKENITAVKVYTIDFPPDPVTGAVIPAGKARRYRPYLLLAAGIVLTAAGWLLWRRRRGNAAVIPVTEEEQPAVEALPEEAAATMAGDGAMHTSAAIYLFGQFEVFDREGSDITRMFTPLLKELFLVIFIHSVKDGKGISSEQLYDMLWGDKSHKDARNNFSVNIVKLRAILQKIGDCHLGKESGKWKVEIKDPSVKADYERYVHLLQHRHRPDKAFATELLGLVQRGPFLGNVDYEWLDDIRSGISGDVTDLLLQYISTADMASEAAFIISLANCIFLFDKLNEEALAYKSRCLVLLKKHGMAREAYLKFAKEYRESYGQDFERSFREMTLQE